MSDSASASNNSKIRILESIEANLDTLLEHTSKLAIECKDNFLHLQMCEQMIQAIVLVTIGVETIRTYEERVSSAGNKRRV